MVLIKRQLNQASSGGGHDFESYMDEQEKALTEKEAGEEKGDDNQEENTENEEGRPPVDSVEKMLQRKQNEENILDFDKKEAEGGGEEENEFITDLDSLTKTQSTEAGTDEEKKQKLELARKVEFYDNNKDIIEKDPLFNTLIEFRKAGKNSWAEFTQHIGGPDISSMSNEEVFRFALKEIEGVTDPDELEEQVNDYMGMSEKMQNQQVKAIKDAAENARNERIEKFGLTLKTEQQIKQQHAAKGHQDLKAFVNNVTGKSYLGTVITPEMTRTIQDAMVKDFALYDTKEGYLIKDSFDFHFWKLFRMDIIKNIEAQAISKGRMEATEKVVNASSSSVVREQAGNPPGTEEDNFKRETDKWMQEKALGY